MNNYSNFSSSGNSNHVLIENNNNYYVDKKLLYVSSNDRDISKWLNCNEFEIHCPQSYSNVQSIKLVDIQLPNNIYNISNYLQNNKLYILDTTITVPDGLYTPELLASTLEFLFNNITSVTGNPFKVEYNKVTNKFYIKVSNSNSNLDFIDIIQFTKALSYDISCNTNKLANLQNNINVYAQYNNWGLGALMGFNKIDYSFHDIDGLNDFAWDSSGGTINNDITNSKFKGIKSSNQVNLFGDNNIFMELDKYNSYDELTPYIESNSDGSCVLYNKFYSENSIYTTDYTTPESDKLNKLTYIKNSQYYKSGSSKTDYNGAINTAFAKIPMNNLGTNKLLENANNNISNISFYNPPVERITKFKFKFRYHNGILIDFQNLPVTFTLEITQLKNEFRK